MSSPPRERFLELFTVEASSRLRRLSEHLLALEAGPSEEAVAAILRECHSLKGAAAVVGLADVTAVAHRMEDALEPHRRAGAAPPTGLIDALLAATDGLQALLPEVRRDADTGAATKALLAGLEHNTNGPAAAAPPAPATVPDAVVPQEAPAPVEARRSDRTAARAPAVDVVELPAARLDELVRSVGESAATNLRLGRLLGERLGEDPERISEFRDLSRSIRHLQEKAVRARMVPLATITGRLHRAVRDTARAADKPVRWEVVGEDTEIDRTVLQELTDALVHLVRNAVDHGIEPVALRRERGKLDEAVVRVTARQAGADVVVSVIDDGGGIDASRVREEAQRHGLNTDGYDDDAIRSLIFTNGVSTAEAVSATSGRGVGLDAVRASVERLRGSITVQSSPGVGTTFTLSVPVAAAIVPCLLVSSAGQRYALPLASIVITQSVDAARTTRAQGEERCWVGEGLVALGSLSATLGGSDDDHGAVVVVRHDNRIAAYRVAEVLGQRDVFVAPLGAFVPRLQLVAGAAVEPDGSILLVLDAAALASRTRHAAPLPVVAADASEEAAPVEEASPRTTCVLVADDALTIRELQRSILEHAGYRVLVAEDGQEALATLTREHVDLVLTDVDMPRMDGFALTRAIREDAQLTHLPVVILSSKSAQEDQQRGLDAGADTYLVKESFGEAVLLAAVERLVGRAQ